MSKIVKVRTDTLKFDFEIPDGTPEIFVDGVASTNFGVPHCRLSFFRVDPPVFGENRDLEDGVEPRKAVMHVTMPTPALLEFAKKTLEAFEQNKDSINIALLAYDSSFRERLPK